jgi:hypothetical protein
MKERLKRLSLILCAQICTSIPLNALAESRSIEGSGDAAMAATARLKLQVNIPRFLYFRVGSAGSTMDTITFEPPAGAVGNGSIVSGSGGDAAGGSGASVSLRSNAGQITIVANNDGGAGGLGSGGAVSLADISVRSDSNGLATPSLTDAGGSVARVVATRGNVTDRHATWTYEYRNRHAVAPGVYNAEIIYTAISP